jgi:curved DNA-binding protein CbpA
VSPSGDPRPGPDPYKTLQVDPEADPDVIQAAYRRLARKYHPDVSPGPEAAERMIAINRAWELLRDPARRAAFDASRSSAPAPSSRAHEGPTADGGGARSATSPRGGASDPAGPGARGAETAAPSFESVSRDWTSGRSGAGSGYDPATMGRSQSEGSAGPPPGGASGSVLNFGRYSGWSLGEIGRKDLEYLEWLDRAPIGRAYRDEIDAILRRTGRRRSGEPDPKHRGLFRRR